MSSKCLNELNDVMTKCGWEQDLLEVKIRPVIDLILQGRIHDVLDIGCGPGTVLTYLASLYPIKAIGLDEFAGHGGSEKALEIFRENIRNLDLSSRVRIIKEDALSTSMEPNEFDLIMCMNSLHHIMDKPNGQQLVVTFFRNIFRWLRPTGYIWIMEVGSVNYVSFLKYVIPKSLVHINPIHDVVYSNKREANFWVERLKVAGFNILNLTYHRPNWMVNIPTLLPPKIESRFGSSVYFVLAEKQRD